MNNSIKNVVIRLMGALMLIAAYVPASAQTWDEPVITFKTNIYDSYGESNQFSLVIGTVDSLQYIDVDCGYGKVEYVTQQARIDSLSQIGGTYIECQVSKEGLVKIYGDPAQIDYLNASGCYISWIEFSNSEYIDILDLSHNELESLDLSAMTNVQALYLSDNKFTAATPLKIGGNKPNLKILEMNTIDYLDESFNLSDYPALISFDGYHNLGLKKCDPTGCPNLLRLTLDVTPVETIDVSKNGNLMILNVSNTRITNLDVSHNPYLIQLYCDHSGSYNNEYKIESLDITHNPELVYLFCAGNKLTSLDISKCPKLITLSATDNYLTSIDVSHNPNLYIVEINKNCMDFATLPLDPGVWNTYYYGQRNFPVEKSYKVGATFDFSGRVLREGGVTEAIVYSVSEASPESPTPIDASSYTYADGVLTINEIPEDSIYIAFANTLFPDAIMQTEKFKILSEEDYGKDVKTFTFTTAVAPGQQLSFSVGIAGATALNPKDFYVNLGDGNLVKFVATSADVPSTPNVIGSRAGYGPVEVYVKDGDQLTAVDIRDITLYSANTSVAPSLHTLNIVNAGLYSIDLSMNRCLASLDLQQNNLSSLTLAGANGYYEKNSLAEINLSNNRLTDLKLNNIKAIKSLNLSNNQLTAIDLSDADYIINVDLSNNLLESLDFTYCSVMTSLNVSGNKLSSIVMPTEIALNYFNCSNNYFTLATLPAHGALADENYIYAPQADLPIPTKGPGIDLSEQNIVINGVGTVFTWKDSNGNVLNEGVDYTINNGVTIFRNIEVGNIVCEMTNAAYPQFAGDKVFKTTPILAAAMPTNVVASFTTLNDGEVVSLSLAAEKSGTAIYIGWDGNENLSQYMLESTYKLFSATTKANTLVNVYTYDDGEKLSVFSMSGATLGDCDVSKLTDAVCINVSDASLSSIKLPQGTTLSELTLDGNAFTEFDVTPYPSLTILSLNNNQLTGLDVSSLANLQLLSASYNQLSSIKLNNPLMWALYLDNNNFTTIDFDGAPAISQLSLSSNQLTSINVDELTDLRMLSVTGNNLTFATLPRVKAQYAVYYYANQAPITVPSVNGMIDLSDQYMVESTETVYRWFLNAPEQDEEGNLVGEELIIDTEYTLDKGVTQFLTDFNNVMCVMTNAALPNVFIYTNLMNVSGIEELLADNSVEVKVVGGVITITTDVAGQSIALHNMNGSLIASTITQVGVTTIGNLQGGIYVLSVGSKVYKLLVK